MKPSLNIQFTSTFKSEDIGFLTEKINHETPEFGAAYPFAFFLLSDYTPQGDSLDKDEKSQIVVGVSGSVIFGSIYTDPNCGYIQNVVKPVWDIN